MHFEFNFYSSLLLPGVIQGILFCILLLRRGQKEERRSDFWLALLLLLCTCFVSVWMLGFAGWYDQHNGYTTFMFYFPWNHAWLIGPVLYFYFRSLTSVSFQLEKRHWWYLAPGLLNLLLKLFAFLIDILVKKWWLGQELPEFYGTKGSLGQLEVPILGEVGLQMLWIFFFLILTVQAFGRYRRYLRENFSTTEDLEFSWLRNLLIGVIVAIIIIAGVVLAGRFLLDLDYQQYWVSHFAMAVLVYYLSIAGYQAAHRVPVVLSFSPQAAEPQVEPAPEEVRQEDLSMWKERVERYIREKHPYLNPNLSLQDLAQELNTNASVLSKIINQQFGQNFNDFINRYRVEALKQRLADPGARQFTLLALALESGFNSKATFNRAFRKFTGKSPGEYLESLNELKRTGSTQII